MAQLVERCVRNAEATSSSLVISTNQTHFRTVNRQRTGVCFFVLARKTPASSGVYFLPDPSESF